MGNSFRNTPKSLIWIIFLLLFLVSGFYIFKKYLSNDKLQIQQLESQSLISKSEITIGNVKILVDVAKTPEEKQKGLSGREKLGDNEGMLFVFENKTYPTFWMIDMRFPIDIIWIADGKVVYIHENVPNPSPETPNSELPLYRPPVGIDYVLEANAGFSRENGIKAGDTVDIYDTISEESVN